MFFPLLSLFVLFGSIALVWYPRANIPDFFTNNIVIYVPNLVPEHIGIELNTLMHSFGKFPSNVGTKGTGFVPVHPHIGEAIPINPDGSCDSDYLIPSVDYTMCHLAERVDIGKHYIMTGGHEGSKENFDDLLDRVSSFTKYTFVKDLDKYPPVKELFSLDSFQSSAAAVCPAGKTVLDPLQFSFIMQVPGQTVAMHIDAPYFWGASRFEFPQWLLATMLASNLFQAEFIDQIQVVAYLHKWKASEMKGQGGDFVYYANNSYIGKVLAEPLAGSLVDGSKTFHAAMVYRNDVKAPRQPKGQDCNLLYVPTEQEPDAWEVNCDGKTIQKYTENDLRQSLVYRARCFSSEEEKERYHSSTHRMTLEEVLGRFEAGLIKQGVATRAELDKMSKLDFAMLIMDTYMQYPKPPLANALVPFNYCALTKYQWAKPLLSFIC